MNLKKMLADHAQQYLSAHRIIGLGSGSTVNAVIDAMPQAEGQFMHVVAASKVSANKLMAKGYQITPLNGVQNIACYIDGADEVDPYGYMIKGGGGAQTSEKCLAQIAETFICLIDHSKRVSYLGQKHPVALEVLPFARSSVARLMMSRGAKAIYRNGFVTDHGHHIIDVHDLDLSDVHVMDQWLNSIPGVVGHGLFVKHRADIVLCAQTHGVDTFLIDHQAVGIKQM